MAVRSAGSESSTSLKELTDDQWHVVRDLLFSSHGYYGSDARTEAESFRAFHAKFVGRRNAQAAACLASGPSDGQTHGAASSSSSSLDLPQRFDNRYRINHAMLADGASASDPLNLRNLSHDTARRMRRAGVTELVLKELRMQLHMFEDFQQKRQLAAVQKMQADRAKLPVMAFADQIVQALRSKQVLVHLVEDDHVVLAERRLAGQLAQQHALRHEERARLAAAARLETHLVADAVAKLALRLDRHAPRQ